MTISKRLLLVVGVAAVALAGCGGGGKGGMTMVMQPPMAPPRLEDQFGAGFGAAFRQDRNGEPGEPAAGAIEPLSVTNDPREIS
jgi:hypothetical protein